MVKTIVIIMLSIMVVILSIQLNYLLRHPRVIGCPEYEQVFRQMVRDDYKRLQTR